MFTVYVPQSVLITWQTPPWLASIFSQSHPVMQSHISESGRKSWKASPPLKMLIFHLQSKLICLCVCSPQCSPWVSPPNTFIWRHSHCGTLISWLHTMSWICKWAWVSDVFMDSNHAFSRLCQFIKEVEHEISFCSLQIFLLTFFTTIQSPGFNSCSSLSMNFVRTSFTFLWILKSTGDRFTQYLPVRFSMCCCSFTLPSFPLPRRDDRHDVASCRYPYTHQHP